jgi:uncharacterized protein (DUF1800 family)
MSLFQDRQALIALNRFGMGAKPGSVAKIRQNAKAAVLAEINKPDIAKIKSLGLPTYAEACRAVDTNDFEVIEKIRQKELLARLKKHMSPTIGFVERLVLFFSNHFSMSVNKGSAIRATIGQLERDVIRKNVLGSFETMLIGVMQHPAMLDYLDNADSTGPNSPYGLETKSGFNKNLAREILELHTMGVGGGYQEKDVKSLAAMLTGWSFVRGWQSDYKWEGGTTDNRGRFLYRARWHEPGAKKFLGKSIADTGKGQVIAALKMLAHHPATAQFIAYKLVKHFITDQPTPLLVNPVAKAFRTSGGNLKKTAEALVNLPAAWSLPMQKIRTPYELQVAEMRATKRRYSIKRIWDFFNPLNFLGQVPWEHPSPDGWPDESDYWSGPNGMRLRFESSQYNAYVYDDIRPITVAVPALATRLFGAALSSTSKKAITGATSLNDGLTTLFMIPEFQRR